MKNEKWKYFSGSKIGLGLVIIDWLFYICDFLSQDMAKRIVVQLLRPT